MAHWRLFEAHGARVLNRSPRGRIKPIGVIASILRAFPERFELNVPREGGEATVKLR